MNDTATTRPPTLKQLEARAAKAQAARAAAWERVKKTQAAHAAALGCFADALGHETFAFGSLCAARGVKGPSDGVRQTRPEVPGPPAPETLTAADEED